MLTVVLDNDKTARLQMVVMAHPRVAPMAHGDGFGPISGGGSPASPATCSLSAYVSLPYSHIGTIASVLCIDIEY